MRLPLELSAGQIARYEAIFAARDGEQLLREWGRSREKGVSLSARFRTLGGAETMEEKWREELRQQAQRAGSPLEIGHLSHAIDEGKTEFASACLRVLPDRFFDLRRPLECRDQHQFQNEIFVRLLAYAGDIEMSARYHQLLELMVQRGWDPLYGTRIPKIAGASPAARDRLGCPTTEWSLRPALYEVAGRDNSTPLLRRLLPYVGGLQGLRKYSDSYCGGLAREERDATLLHRAAQAQDVEMIRFFVQEVGIDPGTTDALGRTALVCALQALDSGRNTEAAREVVHELIDLGLDIEHRDQHGETALVAVVGDDRIAAVKFLIELGADTTVRFRDGATLVQLAEGRGLDEVARILRSHEMARMLDAALPADKHEDPDPGRASAGLTL